MPRPSEGYKNVLGNPVPGVTDITGRFKNSGRLLYWAFNVGKSGAKTLYDDVAINIGTAVHAMAELDLKGRSADDIAFYAQATLREREHLEAAQTAFLAFRQWREEFHVRPYRQEISLVSEKHQYGGTIDTVAVINNGLGLVDFKTSKGGEVYPEMVIQLAAYAILWEENFPNEPLDQGCHLIVLPKDGSKPVHRVFNREQLEPFAKFFDLCRQAYALDHVVADPKALAGDKVAPSVKPVARVKAKSIEHRPTMTMAELLRSYGHVKEGVTV